MKYMEELLIKKFIEKELECGEHKCLDNIRAKRVRGGDIYVAHELSITDFNSDPIHRKEEGDMVLRSRKNIIKKRLREFSQKYSCKLFKHVNNRG